MSFADDYDFDFDFEKTCKYCGTNGLEWVLRPQGWRLADADGKLHRCKPSPADDFAVPIDQCRYTEGKVDGWGADWTTGCGRTVRCETPIDVGPQFPPLPNSDGKFCHYCGKLIVLFSNSA